MSSTILAKYSARPRVRQAWASGHPPAWCRRSRYRLHSAPNLPTEQHSEQSLRLAQTFFGEHHRFRLAHRICDVSLLVQSPHDIPIGLSRFGSSRDAPDRAAPEPSGRSFRCRCPRLYPPGNGPSVIESPRAAARIPLPLLSKINTHLLGCQGKKFGNRRATLQHGEVTFAAPT